MARRQGMPLVVTDEAGKSPVVVLPLEVYEAMFEGASEPEPVIQPIKHQAPVSEPPKTIEITMEERFSIEPLDEQENR